MERGCFLMIRLSSYTIFSEPLPDQKIVLMNGASGALDIITPELAAFFKEILKCSQHGEALIAYSPNYHNFFLALDPILEVVHKRIFKNPTSEETWGFFVCLIKPSCPILACTTKH
jgi:hypothetical protein